MTPSESSKIRREVAMPKTQRVILRSFVVERATKNLSADPTERFFGRNPTMARPQNDRTELCPGLQPPAAAGRRLEMTGVVALSAAMALLGIGCGEKPQRETPEVVRPVKTLVVGSGLTGGLNFPGTVRGSERGELSFQVSGPLVELPVDEGDRVSRGTLLARIDPTDYNLAIAEAQATYDQSVSDYRRYQRLYEKEAVPLADVELKRAVRDVSAAKLEQARNNLGYTYLRAPFSGRIGRKYIENFEDVRAKEPVLTLHRIDTVEVTIDVPESLVTRFRGDPTQALAFATFETHPDHALPLTLKEISAEADAATQTYQAAFTM